MQLRRQTRDKTDTKLTDKISGKRSSDISKAADKMNEAAGDMIKQIACEAAKGLDIKQMEVYARALKNLKDVIGIKTDLEREEQQARIANLRRQAESDTVKDTHITVEFGNYKELSE